MINLLKADFFRIIKSKLFVICTILTIVIPIFVVLMYYGIYSITKQLDEGIDEIDMLGSLFTANKLIASSFSLTDNFGLVIPVFSGIYVARDLINGTLRNKVIAGHTRTKIYLSHLVTSVLFNLFLIVLYAGVTAGLSLLFFDYGPELNGEGIKNLIFMIALGVTSFLFVATVSTFFGLLFNSLAPTIILTVTFCLVLSFFSTVVSLTDYEEIKYLVYFIPLFFNGTTLTLGGVSNVMFIEGMASFAFFGTVNVLLGLLMFNKKDLK